MAEYTTRAVAISPGGGLGRLSIEQANLAREVAALPAGLSGDPESVATEGCSNRESHQVEDGAVSTSPRNRTPEQHHLEYQGGNRQRELDVGVRAVFHVEQYLSIRRLTGG